MHLEVVFSYFINILAFIKTKPNKNPTRNPNPNADNDLGRVICF